LGLQNDADLRMLRLQFGENLARAIRDPSSTQINSISMGTARTFRTTSRSVARSLKYRHDDGKFHGAWFSGGIEGGLRRGLQRRPVRVNFVCAVGDVFANKFCNALWNMFRYALRRSGTNHLFETVLRSAAFGARQRESN
jgi:hypothetical protein